MRRSLADPVDARVPSTRPTTPWEPLLSVSVLLAGALVGWVVGVLVGHRLALADSAAVVVAAALAALVGLASLRLPARVGAAVLTAVGVFCAVFPYERALYPSPWAWNGLSGDQSFRTELLTRFADSPALADYTYAGLPSFYPPAWFWVTGRLAALLDVQAWTLLRPATTLTVAVGCALAAFLMRRPLGARYAALSAALVVALLGKDLWEPYSFIAGLLALGLLVRLPSWLETPTVGGLVALAAGFVGVFLCYTYGAAILALTALVVAASRASRGRRLVWVLLSGGLALAATSPYWGAQLLHGGHDGVPAQMTWLSDLNTELPWRWFVAPHASAVLASVGALWVLVRGGTSPEGRAMRALLAVGAVWCVGSVALSAAFDVQLQPNRVGELMALVSTGALALLVRDAREHLPRPTGVLRVVSVAALVLGVLAVSASYASLRAESGAVVARATPPPREARDTIRALTRSTGRPARTLTILSTRRDVLALSPMHGFQQWNETYANPGADFRDRAAYLSRLLAATTGDELRAGMAHTPWGPIDALVLKQQGRRAVYSYVFQDADGHDDHAYVAVDRRALDPRVFRILHRHGYVVVVPR